MPREKFEHDLHRLQDEILELGAMAERAIAESVQTLKDKDIRHAQGIIDADRNINEKRYAIENEALTLIATQQPMAGDLRTLAAILEIASELERMADYAKGIANVAVMIGPEGLIKPLVDIPRMASKACEASSPSRIKFSSAPKPAANCRRQRMLLALINSRFFWMKILLLNFWASRTSWTAARK